MWHTQHALASAHLLAATPTPVSDPTVLHVTLSRAGATLVATAFIFALLSLFSQNNFANVARLMVLALGIGSWVITNKYLIEIGDNLRKQLDKALQTSGSSTTTSGSTFTILTILMLAFAYYLYRQKKSKGWLVFALLVSALFFTASFARNLALDYSTHVGVPVAKFIFAFFG